MRDVIVGAVSFLVALVVVALPVLYGIGQARHRAYRQHGERTGEW